jgi:serine/threonine protein kinase
LHRANTSPDLNTKRRKTIDSESTDQLRKLLTSEPTVAQDVNRVDGNFTKSMVITKDENNLFKKAQRNSTKERVVYIAEDDLSFKNSTPGNFGHKSKTATWKTMDVVVKYIEEACLEGCREIYRLINLDESRHQNVLPYLGICVHPASVVVNYMNSGSLRDHLYQTNKQVNLLELREIEWSDVIDWVSQAATGIKFLHDKGVVHGGVATHSFMMQSVDNGKYVLKVSDFGLHRPVKSVELAGRKLHWDAPELVIDGDEDDNSDKVFSRETDSYGFGMCLYEVMHRVQPWKKVKNIDVKKKLENKERPVVNALLSEDAPGFVDIRAIMKSCWEHDPRERSNFETITRVINYSALQCRESEQSLMLPIPSVGGGENQSNSSSEDENQNTNVASVSTTPEKIAEVQTPRKEKNAEKEVTLGLSPLDGRKGPVRSAFDLLAPPSDDEDNEDEKDADVTATMDNVDDVVDEYVNSPKMSLDSPQQLSPVDDKRKGLGELEEMDMGPSQAHNSVFDLLAPPPGIDDNE